jgi:hypothetical protein
MWSGLDERFTRHLDALADKPLLDDPNKDVRNYAERAMDKLPE